MNPGLTMIWQNHDCFWHFGSYRVDAYSMRYSSSLVKCNKLGGQMTNKKQSLPRDFYFLNSWLRHLKLGTKIWTFRFCLISLFMFFFTNKIFQQQFKRISPILKSPVKGPMRCYMKQENFFHKIHAEKYIALNVKW